MDPNDSGGMEWWAELGAFVGGTFTVLMTRLGLRSREQREEHASQLQCVADSIRADGAETRKILTAMRTDLAILLDRDDHRVRT